MPNLATMRTRSWWSIMAMTSQFFGQMQLTDPGCAKNSRSRQPVQFLGALRATILTRTTQPFWQVLRWLRRFCQRRGWMLVGSGMTRKNERISSLIKRHGIENRILLVGNRNDVPAIMNAIDVHVLSSTAEAFPNVLSEAMACGTPCAVTDVGDCASIVGNTGEVCEPQSPNALGRAMLNTFARVRAGTRPCF